MELISIEEDSIFFFFFVSFFSTLRDSSAKYADKTRKERYL